MSNKNRLSVLDRLMVLALIFIGLLMLTIMMSGCYTQKIAEKRVDKVQGKYPIVLSKFCKDKFPVLESISEHGVYVPGKEIQDGDGSLNWIGDDHISVGPYIGGSSVITPGIINAPDTVYITKRFLRVDTFRLTKEVVRESTAKLDYEVRLHAQELNKVKMSFDSLATEYSKQEAKATDMEDKRDAWRKRFYWLAIPLGLIALIFILKKFIL